MTDAAWHACGLSGTGKADGAYCSLYAGVRVTAGVEKLERTVAAEAQAAPAEPLSLSRAAFCFSTHHGAF